VQTRDLVLNHSEEIVRCPSWPQSNLLISIYREEIDRSVNVAWLLVSCLVLIASYTLRHIEKAIRPLQLPPIVSARERKRQETTAFMSEDPKLISGVESDIVEYPFLDATCQTEPQAVLRQIAPPERPIRKIRLTSGTVAWILTDAQLGRTVLSDSRFSKRRLNRDENSANDGSHFIFGHMLCLDPPEQTRLRALISNAFARHRIAERSQEIHVTCDRLIAALRGVDEAEIVSGYARPLSLATISSIVGIPLEDQPRIRHWSDRLVIADFEDPSMFPRIAEEMCSYFEKLFQRARRVPSESIFSSMSEATENGAMTKEEMFAMAFLLLNAGYETSANLIASGILALLRDPSQWSPICQNPSLTTRGLEELLRIESPLQMTTPRFSTVDISIAGERISAGDMVFVALGAANRGASQFSEPDKLDIFRENASQHLSFGYGPHYCVGAHLARLECEIAIGRFAQNFPNARYDETKGTPVWNRGFVMRGLSKLHLLLGEPSGQITLDPSKRKGK
jgi:cytochrome P450